MIKRLLAAYRLAKEAQQYVDIADQSDFWTPQNAAAATSFFKGFDGQRLMIRLRNIMFISSIKACSPQRSDDINQESGDFKRGAAYGVLCTIQAIERHFTPPSAHDGTSELDTDEQALA